MEARIGFLPREEGNGFWLQVPGKPPSKGSFKVVSTRGFNPKSILLSQTPGPMAEFDGRVRYVVARDWERLVTREWLAVIEKQKPISIAYFVHVTRPKSHYHKPRGSDELRLKPNAPEFPTGAPDLSKVQRAVEDTLVQCRMIPDDRFIIAACARRRFAAEERMLIVVREGPDPSTMAASPFDPEPGRVGS